MTRYRNVQSVLDSREQTTSQKLTSLNNTLLKALRGEPRNSVSMSRHSNKTCVDGTKIKMFVLSPNGLTQFYKTLWGSFGHSFIQPMYLFYFKEFVIGTPSSPNSLCSRGETINTQYEGMFDFHHWAACCTSL